MNRRGLLTSALTLPLFTRAAHAAPPLVVLELFTSQGCSSCPPADALLGTLVKQPGVIGLAWHVDYWNSLGWRDPFAQRAWTGRQRSYAAALRGEVYTPALVVNGAAMVVGSDQAAVERAISAARGTALAVDVTLRRDAAGLTADIGAVPGPVTMLLVVYDPFDTTQVGAGENSGRHLVEYRVVRDATLLSGPSNRPTLPSVRPDQGAVLLVQDQTSRVIGAADLPPDRPATVNG